MSPNDPMENLIKQLRYRVRPDAQDRILRKAYEAIGESNDQELSANCASKLPSSQSEARAEPACDLGVEFVVHVQARNLPKERLFEQYVEKQFTLAMQLLGGDKFAAEDACQKARRVVLSRNLGKKKPIVGLWPYLRRATIGACYEELRWRYRERQKLAGVASQYAIREAVDPAIASMLADVRLTSERIVRQYRGSPSLAIFRLRYSDGLSIPEIAERLGLSPSAVKRHNRAILVLLRKKLREI